ncbi:MAG: rhodanese-like domain-containing protein [Micropruina glycogenica]
MPDIESVVAQARAGIVRVTADELAARLAAGAWVIDIRPVDRREAAGHIPGAVVVDRLVLGGDSTRRLPTACRPGPALTDEVYVVCNEGYSSSLAARDLSALGFTGQAT